MAQSREFRGMDVDTGKMRVERLTPVRGQPK